MSSPSLSCHFVLDVAPHLTQELILAGGSRAADLRAQRTDAESSMHNRGIARYRVDRSVISAWERALASLAFGGGQAALKATSDAFGSVCLDRADRMQTCLYDQIHRDALVTTIRGIARKDSNT